jgi:pilus assembly protein TadC
MKFDFKFNQSLEKFVESLTKRFTYLKHNLAQASMAIKAEDFVKKNLKNSLIIALTLSLSAFFILIKKDYSLFLIIPIFIVFYLLSFLFLMNTPKAVAAKKVREIDYEITYAGRFLLIELSAGVPLFDAIKNVSLNFEFIGKHFKEIIQRVEYGKPIEQALNEIMEITPSDNFRKMIFTIVNSLRTGADVSTALQSVIEQISKEKLIKIKEYGKKLNPIVMFYLIIAVIATSLGIAVLTLLSSFLGLSFNLSSLLGMSFGIALIQLVFISIVDSLRRGI